MASIMDVRNFIVALCLSAPAFHVFAARRMDIPRRISRRLVAPPRGNTAKQPSSVDSGEELFGLVSGERLERSGATYETVRGTLQLKMAETYKGLPVIGESVVLEIDGDGKQLGVPYGRLVEGLAESLPSVHANLSASDAFCVVLSATGDSVEEVMFKPEQDAQLVVYVQGTPANLQPKVIYQLSYRIENAQRVSRPSFYIDANTGSILRRWEGLSGLSQRWRRNITTTNTTTNTLIATSHYVYVDAEGGNIKTGKILYNGDKAPQLQVTRISNKTCSLKNPSVIVFNCKNSYTCPLGGATAHEFDCDSGNVDEVNGGYSPLNDALFHVGVTLKMYREWYRITDLFTAKGSRDGGRCAVRGHYGVKLETAFWDGEYLTFGDGDKVHYPLTSINVVAHELSHGFTEKVSGLIYEGESGAINEAFSDMAGEVAEEFLKQSVDWTVASDSLKGKDDAMRYFADPKLDGRSPSTISEYCFTMDPHISSGIFNKVFYTLSNTAGWNVTEAFRVFLIANYMHWHPDSDFNSAACDVLHVAADLEYNQDDVIKAFKTVGIEPCKEPDLTVLSNPIIMQAGGSVTFELTSSVMESLRYSDLVVYVYGNTPADVTVTGSSNRFIATKQQSVYDTIEFNAVAIHTFHQCLNRPCTVTLKTEEAGKVILNPLAYVGTLISDESMRRTGDTFQLQFEIPSNVLRAGLQVAFTAEKVGGELSYYIRHGQPPVVEVGNFEVINHGSLPTVLCTPRTGTYYLKAKAEDGRVTNINIHMYALLKATRANLS